MAEVAPLTAAHAHARTAAQETESANWDGAINEHQQAASGFARAARDTGDYEALRVLKLLEAQHEKLAQIIRSQGTAQATDIATEEVPSDSKPTSNNATSLAAPADQSKAAKPSTTSALAAARLNARARDSSPNLARDIATRRGIPPPSKTTLSPAAQARVRQLSPESQRRAKPSITPQIPPSIMDSQSRLPRKPRRPEDDPGFASFYNNLTTGTMSKLSSVLAYAGLPLTAEEATQPAELPKRNQPGKRTVSASTEPDVKKYFSKAALNAIEDSYRQRGAQGQVFGPAESFYVVQTGGGTYSYADIAKAKQQQLSDIGEENDEDSFVDAREAQMPASPKVGTQPSRRASFGKSRTAEELELENTTLKTTLESLASRLATFEAHAQDASMAALTQSMASLHNSPTAAVHHPTPLLPQHHDRDAEAALQRVQELEAEMKKQAEGREKLERLAEKQEKKIRMYHSKWEDIKKSAREKERVKREKAEEEGAGAAAS